MGQKFVCKEREEEQRVKSEEGREKRGERREKRGEGRGERRVEEKDEESKKNDLYIPVKSAIIKLQ